MNAELRQRLIHFVRPLYQDLDGVSHFDDVERVSAIARQLYTPPDEAARTRFELMLLFQGLAKWLERVGNLSRTVLTVGSGITESDLRAVLESLNRLEHPRNLEERALASAIYVDSIGIRGLVGRFLQARREGVNARDVARDLLAAQPALPDWLFPQAREWALQRMNDRRLVCERFLNELNLEDLQKKS